MLYKEILEINKSFQYSVNIDYDLHNEEKIKEYIPTSDVCDVLKFYIKSMLGYEKNRSTLLIGPYGKGKSFLILSLLRMVCFESNKHTETLLKKIEEVDKELFGYIKEVQKKKIKLLPVIIDSNYYNIEQSFLLALNDALKAFGLENIIPNTVFDVCLELIEKWENNEKNLNSILLKCQKQTGINLKDLKAKLREYDRDAYYKFESLYNCTTSGLKFNPMVNSDIVKTYSDINNQIKEYGYSGMFIVYDEFSKTLESKNSYLAHDLKVIQDFAEKSSRSSNEEQMHLCCITHKTFDLYYNNDKNSPLSDAFKTVSGRFKEIRFNRSLEQNYQIISFTLNKKNAKYNSVCEKYIKDNQQFYDLLSELSFFDKEDESLLFKNCFPFNPLTVYSLIRIAELIAQNERTMFTLISDTDEHSFNTFISNNGTGLYNANHLYDYFSSLLQNESGDLKEVWYRCETACKRTAKNEKKNILKTLAIIEMLDDYSKLSPTEEIISLMLNQSSESIKKYVSEMIDDRIIKKTIGSHYLDFAYNNSKEIEEEIEKYVASQRANIKESEILGEVCTDNFVIPRKYNTNYKMTRFFKNIFVTEKEFFNLTSFDLLFEKNACDGVVIRILKPTKSAKTFLKHFEEMQNSKNVVIVIPNEPTEEIIEEAVKVKALLNIKKNGDINTNILNQIEMMISEKTREINAAIKDVYCKSDVTYLSESNKTNLSDAVNDLCVANYSQTPIINNEMLNKHMVTSAYQKPRNVIINMILNRNIDVSNFSKSSPEMTVYKTFYTNNKLNEDSMKIVSMIKEQLLKKYKEKKSINPIISKFTLAPFGIRKGILPMYIALAISYMDDNVVLYFENSEIDINANNIDKICLNPQQYYFVVEEKSKEQDDYLKKLIRNFNGTSTESFYVNIKLAANMLRKWAVGLPMIIKESHDNSNYLNLPSKYIETKDLLLKFNLNSYELLTKEIPEIFNFDYKCVNASLKKYQDFDKYISPYIDNIASNIKDKFIKEYKGSIASCYKQWIIENNINFNKVIFEGKGLSLHKLLKEINHDNQNAVNQIALLLTGYSVNDWAGNYEDKIYIAIDNLINDSKKIKQAKKRSTKKYELSSMGKMFQNNIESIVDEFADSISNEEKVEILSTIIEKYAGDNK